MFLPTDRDYQQAKRRKLSGKTLPSPFRELAAWIASTYGVSVLDIHYKILSRGDRPRLNVVLEWKRDAEKFCNDQAFDKAKANKIRAKFKSLLAKAGNKKFPTDRLFVIFSAFEEVARREANDSITDRDLRRLKRRLANRDLWRILRILDGVTFFFRTDAQVVAAKASDRQRQFAEEYARIVAPYDEFGYLAKAGIRVTFDSKENFDTNFQSNWFNYLH